MKQLTSLCERVAGTSKKLEKIALVGDYLKSRTTEEASASAIFLTGRPFAAWDQATLNVGGTSLWRIVSELAATSEARLTAAYRQHGDLGAAATDVLPARNLQTDLSVVEVQNIFRQI